MVVHDRSKNTWDKRRSKARKIEDLLDRPVAGADLLDLGTGSGFLAQYFVEAGANVSAADADGYRYAASAPYFPIDGSNLPFSTDAFDIVIFNHVIEHVGERAEQDLIMAEIARVLRPGGVLYLGVPNAWALIEAHYKLPVLGALPPRIADWLVRTIRRQPRYDCRPFTHGELVSLTRRHFATVIDRSPDAYRWVMEHEAPAVLRSAKALRPPLVLLPSFIILATNPIRSAIDHAAA
jgi:SAM-dependent methyltransferase